VTVWQNLGLSFLVMSAGLQSVPDDLLDAAAVDGARPWTRFWRVTVPLLTPVLFFAAVVGTILAFQSFGQIDLLTKGGPLGKTNVLTYFIVTELRVRNDPGTAAVLSIALFVITLGFTWLQMRLLERRVTYAR
jgi:sn-glycerol 3-phosphate transport system permease protein